jgi:hypothetical protein
MGVFKSFFGKKDGGNQPKLNSEVTKEEKKVESLLCPIELEMKYLWVTDKELIRSYVRNNNHSISI